MLEFAGAATRLVPGDLEAEAEALHCTPAVIHAVCDVEAGGSGFLPDGRPKILFEAHIFGRLTRHLYDAQYPNISAPSWNKALYGAGGAHQYDRLGQAIALNRDAALQSASWGLFQILGMQAKPLGYSSAETFVTAMVSGERAQLHAFVAFCQINRLDRHLRSIPPAFAAFASGYNGAGYAANSYDTKLAAAWRKWLATPAANANPAPRTDPAAHYSTLQQHSNGTAVAALQVQLNQLGAGVSLDGDFGPETLAAVVAFQRAHGLVPDGIVGPSTRAALDRVAPPLAAAA